MGLADFVIVGFPRCGTTALAGLLGATEGAHLQTMGRLREEAPFFSSDSGVDALREATGDGVNGHKYSAYIYDETALQRIREHNPEALFIVCIREPLHSLLSWRELHRELASEGTLNHFVNESPESRRFYQTCSLSDYYRRWAGPKLAYARYIRDLRSALSNPRLIVISQEWLAANTPQAVHLIASQLGLERTESPASAPQHLGSTAAIDIELDREIWAEIEACRRDLRDLLEELHDQPDVTLLCSG